METRFLIELLNPSVHRREEFSCESPELTAFLKTRARKEAEARASACFVLVPVNDRGRIAGYYTLSATSIELARLPTELTKKLPRYPTVSATLLGRLARDSAYRGQGLGDLLMADAFRRACENSTIIGSVVIVVDPKDEKASKFYEKFGFKPLDGQRQFLPIKSAQTWLGLGNPGGK